MKIKNIFNFPTIFKSYLFIIIIQILLSFIQSQKCTNCIISTDKKTCESNNNESSGNCVCNNAKPHLDDNSCYNCGNGSIVFYKIFSNETCVDRTIEGCDNKIIYDSNECVGHCPSNYCELGDFCYSETSFPSTHDITDLTFNPFKSCECIGIYNITLVSGNKKKYDCVSQCSNFYNSDKNMCVDNCEENEKIYIKYENGDEIVKRCSLKCKSSEFFYALNNSCLDSCPNNTFKKTNTDLSKECVENCDIYKFEESIEPEQASTIKGSCVSKCENGIIVFDIKSSISNETIKYCTQKENYINYYYYNGIYFRNCSDTKKLFDNINTYPYEKKTIDISDTLIETTLLFKENPKKLCVEDCSNFDSNMFFDGKECVPKCELYYYKKKCLNTCKTETNIHNYRINFNIIDINEDIPSFTIIFTNQIVDINQIMMTDSVSNPTITINKNDYPEDKECLEKCPTGTFIDKENYQCNVLKCNYNKYIKSNLECGTCNKNEGFIVKENFFLELSSNSDTIPAQSLPTEIYNITREYCLSSCPKSSPYHNYGENECFNTNCSVRGKVSAYDNPYVCYQSCKNITESMTGDITESIVGYNFEKDNICYKEPIGCDKDYFYMINGIKQCADEKDCKSINKHYIQDKECVDQCSINYYIIKPIYNAINVQNLGACLLDPKDCINQGYYVYENKTCSKVCDFFSTSEKAQNENNETCFKSCPPNFPYKDEKQKYCLKKCENFFHNYTCLENCDSYYYFIDSNECINDCKVGDTYYYKKDDNSKICYYSCPPDAPFVVNVISPKQQNEPYKCKEKCNDSAPYYYDDLKECRKDCDVLYNSNHTICVYQCEAGEKVNVYNKTCVKDCPKEFPYILKEKLSDTRETIVEKCVANCTKDFPLKSNKNKTCLKECLLDENYEYNGICYEKCPNGTYSDEYNKKCSNVSCPSDLYKYYEKENGIYKCTKSCSFGKYYTLEGGECKDTCPDGYNYIGNDYICLKGLNDCLQYGEYYKKFEEFGNNTFKCLKSCDNLIVYDTKECVAKCPESYYQSPNGICYKLCKLDKEYPFSTIDENNIAICSKKCNDLQPYYGEDNKCRNNCTDLKGTAIIDYDKKCVSNCTNPFYQYLENGKCVYKCKNYVNNKKECVEKCDGDYNYIEDNECRKSCDEGNFAEQVENITSNPMFECKTKCSPDKYYYEEGNIFTVKKCFNNCSSDFIIQDTHICTAKCPSDYYSYYYVKNSTNSTYKNNTCVKKCPEDKKYIYLGQCYSECPFSQKYHLEGEVNCRFECPKGSKIENNECRSQCSDGKFLDNNQCVNNCTYPNNYYMEGSNECVKNCEERGYFSEGKKCVKSCSEINAFLNGTNCVSECESKKYYVNNTEEGIKKTCIDECPSYSYLNSISNITICKDECNYKLNGTKVCKDICEGDYKFYDSNNGNCLYQCPENQFYINEAEYLDNNTICYAKCPNNYPYHNTVSHICSNKCDSGYLNFTSKKCMANCGGKIFVDNETKYCLNDCKDLGLFEFGEKCTRNCSEEGKDLLGNMESKKCECFNFFYIDETNRTICVDNCPESYKYRLFKTRQCLKNCTDNNYILSLDEKYCYRQEDKCPLNTKKKPYTKEDGIAEYKCDCSYKFYKIKNTESIVCLGENEECPNEYSYIKENTSECTYNCTEEKKLGNICLNEDKTNSNQYWYFNETEQKYHSIENCDKIDFLLIDNSTQCVQSCKYDNYLVYPNINGINKCLPNCDGIDNTIVKRVNSSRSYYECACIDLWYKDNNGTIHCNNNTDKKTCETAFQGENRNYLIKETKECIQKCEGNYPFSFGNECFNDCKDIKSYYDFDTEKDKDNNKKECKCPKLWKNETGKIICINSEICHENGYKLINDTKECTEKDLSNNYKEFNNVYYSECKGNLIDDSNSKCKCRYKWYQYNDNSLNVSNIIVCLGEKDECPKDFYPYLDYSKNQCVEDTSNCSSTIVFNYTCYNECPDITKKKDSENTCECDTDKGKWYQYIYEGKTLFQCGLNECPNNKQFLDNYSKVCKYTCENMYQYNNYCYTECPQNTTVIDELTKMCVDTYPFEVSKDLKSLEENIKTNIKMIYEKTSSNGVIYNINNSTMQLYGINKNKEDKKDVIMRNNLTYIDLSYCLDKLYDKNGLSEDTDIIIIKYDLAEKTNGSTINPVEFKIINSKTGQEIPLDVCDDNSIVISYPLMNILNSFVPEPNNLRNLEEEKNKKNLNLREKFLKGKEIYIDNEEIDTFDLSSKLYTDICYPFKMNGKDLILEDRLNYLYPFCSFCESNCIYNKTDFISERVYCNCNPKDQINFERDLELMNSDPNMKKIKKDQKASILKCLGKISEISKNLGFFYGLIIILAEIAMCILTFLYSYKVFVMRINRKFYIKGDDNINNINNINTENLESVNLSGRDKNYNKNEEIIKTSERNLENPPKKKKQINIIETKEDKKEKRKDNNKKSTNKRGEIIGNADIINIKKTEKDKISQKSNEDKLSSNGYNLYIEKSSIRTFKDSEDENIFELIKLESTLLTVDYQKALQKNKAEILIMILTEILDKIYIIKAIWFLHKYVIVSLYVSLYLLWHMLIISFLSLFYNYSNLHKIWINDNYPNLNFHLSFGFLSCIISFIFYKGLCFLIFNDRKIAELDSIPRENKNEFKERYNKMMFWAKIKIIIFYAVVFILGIIFFLYLMAFCGVYIETKAKLFESYGIALIEVVIIKILYGIALGILRKVSLTYEIEKLYFIVRILDLYIS